MRGRSPAVAVPVIALLVSGCTGSASSPETTGTPDAELDTPVVVTIDTGIQPFCDAMADLNARIDDGELDLEQLADEYITVIPLVPVDIRVVFDAVVEAVSGPTPAGTTVATADVVEATSDPTELESTLIVSPSEALADYLTLNCRRSDDNPGPPPTQPN